MKVATFFSEKGGVGKTTLTAMFASYLAYHCGRQVCAMDFDAPSFHLSAMRERDLALVSDPANRELIRQAHLGAEAYPVIRPRRVPAAYSPDDLSAVVRQLRAQKESRGGYCLLDFPGRFGLGDPVYHLMAAGLIDLAVMPVDTDRQSTESALLLASSVRSETFRRLSGGRVPPLAAVWNRENARERTGARDWYGPRTAELEAAGVKVLPVRIRELVSFRRDADAFRFVRSTLCYPDTNIALNAPYLTDLFDTVKGMLDGGGGT